MLLVVLLANVYVYYKLWHLIPTGNVRGWLVIPSIIIFLFAIISIIYSNSLPISIISVSYRYATSWFFIFLYLLIIFLIFDLLKLIPGLSFIKYANSSWIGFTVLFLFITIILSGGYVNYKNKKRVEHTFKINKTFEKEKVIKIVAISDLHLGFGISNSEFETWVELINSEKPDMVIIAGDIIDNNVKPLYEQPYIETFNKIETKYGIFAVPGNHEYISGIDKSLDFFSKTKVQLLIDSAVNINDMCYIIGRDDKSNPNRKNIKELTQSIDSEKPVILLDHQPFNLNETENTCVDLQFSGHTHYGQLIPISWITKLIFENPYGLVKKNNTYIYVSSGLGIWGGKYRIGSQSEYVIINLENKK